MTWAGGQLFDLLLVGSFTPPWWPDPPTHTHTPHTLFLLYPPNKALYTFNFLHWFQRTLGVSAMSFGHPHPDTVVLNRPTCSCFAFKLWCWCNKSGIISRQSTCLPLYSTSIKLVQRITWAYWSQSSAVERASVQNQCFIFSSPPSCLFFASENEWKTRENPFTSTVVSLPLTLVTHLGKISFVACGFCQTPSYWSVWIRCS